VTDKQSGSALRLDLSRTNGAEYYPVEYTVGMLLRQTKDGSTAANFDVVRVRAHAQYVQRTFLFLGQS
jgi:hypothetical protein